MLVTIGELSFGTYHQDVFVKSVESTIGEVRVGDAEWPLRHGSRPGADYLDAAKLTFDLCTSPLITNEQAANSALASFMAAWRSGLGAAPGVMVPLHLWVGGLSLVVYGRPGRVSPPAPGDRMMRQGAAHFIAEFRVLDPMVYDAAAEAVNISVVPKSLGGIIAPVITPVTTTLTSDTSYRVITVGGEGPAPLRVTFHGPATDPRILVGGVEVGITGTIAYDQDVTVDGRDRTVTLVDGTSYSSRLTRASRLDRLLLDPGQHEIGFTATDRTGTAQATVEATPTHWHI